MLSKQEYRDQAKQKLSQLSKRDIQKSSERLLKKLSGLVERYQVWSVFLPLSNEPVLQPFLDLLLAKGKTIVIPQVDDNLLTPYMYTSSAVIHRGRFGVPTIQNALPYIGAIDIILVPGLAFTSNGKRLGRGGGYYDTFLAQYPHAKKIWLGFVCQLVDELPVSKYDMVLDEIVLA